MNNIILLENEFIVWSKAWMFFLLLPHNFTYDITLLLSTLTLNFLLLHTQPHSLTSLNNCSSKSATSAVSSANTFGLSQTCHHLHWAVPTFSQAHLHSPIEPHHPYIHETTLTQSDINRIPLTHIHSDPEALTKMLRASPVSATKCV